MGKALLHAAINRLLDDGARHLLRSDIVVFGGSNWTKIRAALTEWESKGYLRIIKDPEFAKDDEVCIKMLNYIDRKSPWRDWPPRNNK